MTTKIIYHDFRISTAPESIQDKPPRILKAVEKINAAINGACLFLCGACAAIGVMILCLLAIEA